jgi:hypothetical protein
VASRLAHFRAHDRQAVRLPVELVRSAGELRAVVTDLSLAGAGLETDDTLHPGERITLSLSTPSTWDPLVIDAVVAWSHPPRPSHEVGTLGRSRTVARAGVAFDYPGAATALAMFEMLTTLGYE